MSLRKQTTGSSPASGPVAGIAQLAEHRLCKAAVGVRSALLAWGTEPRPNGRDSRDTVEVTSYFGLLRRLRLSSPISRCLPSCVHRVVVETERSFIWHPAGSIPAPLRRFPRPPSSHHGDRRVGAFLRTGIPEFKSRAVGQQAYRDVRTKELIRHRTPLRRSFRSPPALVAQSG
jgi:hypothetical protein